MIGSKYKATSQDNNVVVKFSDKVIRYQVDSSEMAQGVSNLFNRQCVLELSEIWDTIFESINQYKKQVA
ncbi:hypothetical protein [Halarcobacter sp.]|uniref:hypothetical protein n=1 Tax=Halarcobacter sp. TaxID=2321133 RepID=UPI0029F4FD28|nr:hypothetical protein [Halarcobacter sp.]